MLQTYSQGKVVRPFLYTANQPSFFFLGQDIEQGQKLDVLRVWASFHPGICKGRFHRLLYDHSYPLRLQRIWPIF